MLADKPQTVQIFPLCFGRHSVQVMGLDVLTPAQQAQDINITLTENQTCAPLPLFLRTPKPPLRRFRRKNDFGVSDALYAGSICCPRIEDSFFSGSVNE